MKKLIAAAASMIVANPVNAILMIGVVGLAYDGAKAIYEFFKDLGDTPETDEEEIAALPE